MESVEDVRIHGRVLFVAVGGFLTNEVGDALSDIALPGSGRVGLTIVNLLEVFIQVLFPSGVNTVRRPSVDNTRDGCCHFVENLKLFLDHFVILDLHEVEQVPWARDVDTDAGTVTGGPERLEGCIGIRHLRWHAWASSALGRGYW